MATLQEKTMCNNKTKANAERHTTCCCFHELLLPLLRPKGSQHRYIVCNVAGWPWRRS